jgi:hypothetical protein
MVLGDMPANHCVANILRAPIWPYHTHGKGLDILNLESDAVDDPKNFLLLQKEIEYHFDRMHIMFLPSYTSLPETLCFRVVVLEQPLLSENLVLNSHNQRYSHSIPWSDLNGMEFHHKFLGVNKPFLRLIAQHAFCALRRAQKLGFVDDDSFPSLGTETIQLARHSLDDEQIRQMIERNKLSSLLVHVETSESNEEKESSAETTS